MALFRTRSAAVFGIEAHLIDVEVDMYPGGNARDFITVGMPDTAVRESRERIKSALLNSGFGYPNKSVTINLAPANVRKEGAGFDLPMALGILGAMGTVARTDEHMLVGELVARWHAAAGARRAVDRGLRPPAGHPESAGSRRQRRRSRGHRRRASVRHAASFGSGDVSESARSIPADGVIDCRLVEFIRSAASRFSRCARPNQRQARARSGGGRRPQRSA